ncbi:PREDICTED: uncharacterized protein LOC104774097 [Camelina sativa]|uniref:Uncharacterized protein LOC104728424 n=1 Tax=Camelina sativa TaxID=90675 RepID=A0ABM0Y877_CAMSA|nr:PREDICTED: uncharacterized protein LOC104728424 [Camelina sativa]XP_010497063.1 PREDICTED: uncharacterized protein LOC104774097 [Camelina sativa]
MPPKKSLQQQQHEEQLELMRDMFSEFNHRMHEVLRNTVETTVRSVLRAQQQPGVLPQGEEHREGDFGDVDDDNFVDAILFAQLHEQPRRDMIVASLGIGIQKLDLPDFHGSLQPKELLDWISSVEELLDFKQVPNDMRVPLVATRFKGQASAWWQQLKDKRRREGKEKITSWQKLIKKMKEAFLPFNYGRTMTPTTDTKHTSPDFPVSVSEAHQRAFLIEQQPRFASSSWSQGSMRTRTELNVVTPKQGLDSNLQPMGSGKSDGSDVKRISNARCFGCGEQGHRQSSCPQQTRRGLFIEDEPAIYDDGSVDEVVGGEEEVFGDKGLALVFRRTCLLPQSPEESWLRTNIFRSTCTIRGKFCKLIIDSGSCTNIISEEAVQKLDLFTEPHPCPYRLAWLNSTSEIRISRRCHVPFSIGVNYKDMVCCDILPMDACHILLGRPWQYDRRVYHDGFTNTYAFTFEDKKIKLLPVQDSTDTLTPQIESAPSVRDVVVSKPALFLRPFEFEEEIRTTGIAFVLVVSQEKNVSVVAAPSDFRDILSNFKDVFPDDLPLGLPPLRDIQHCIDLAPNFVLPNRPHYHMSPQKHDELRRQVEELLAKGYLRENLSPCAVPALLIPKKDGSWRMCVDSRAINKITIRYRFPIPRLDDLLDQIGKASIFTKLDLRSGYHQICVRPGDEWKTAFKIREGLFEWFVMPFGLSNAPSTFVRVMIQALRPFIGRCVVVYFDDILIFSSSIAEHLSHLNDVLLVLRKEKLFATTKKCVFGASEVLFLGYIVSYRGLEVRQLFVLGLLLELLPKCAVFTVWLRFIDVLWLILAASWLLLQDCMKGSTFRWTPEAETAFQTVKDHLTSALVLVLPNFDMDFELHCDASKAGIGAVLSQENRPIAFFSEKIAGSRGCYSTYVAADFSTPRET